VTRPGWRWAAGSLLVLVLTWTACFGWVVVVSRQDQRRPVGAIVVLGAAQYNGRPSPVLEARLRHALELYRAGLAPIMVVTGGIGRGDRESEATVGRRWLLEQGVGADAVVVRPEGSTTAASIVAVADWAEGFQITSVLLVSDPFHTARLRQESRRAGLRGWTSPTRTSPISASLRIELPYLLAESWKAPAAWLGWGR